MNGKRGETARLGNTDTFTQIQALRAWASLAVVGFHIGGVVAATKYFGVVPAAQITHFGTHGVLLFFVLSGFIIHRVHAADFGRPDRLRSYVIRRLFRIYPCYWAVLMLVWGFVVLTEIGNVPGIGEVAKILKTILLVAQDRAVVGGTGAPVVVVAWSLQYEMLFYLLIGLFILDVRAGTFATVIFFAAFFVQMLAGYDGAFPSFLKVRYFLLFAFGIGASIAVRWLKIGRSGGTVLVYFSFGAAGALWIADLVAAVVFGAVPFTEHSFAQVGLGAVAAVAIVGTVARERDGGPKAPHWLQAIGNWSYALYLVHFPIVSAVAKLTLSLGLNDFAGAALTAIISLGASLGAAAVVHILVEVPFIRLARLRNH